MRGSFSSTLLALAFGAACAGEPATKRDGEFKVALLTHGPISDHSFPNTVFLITSSEVSGTNVAGIRFGGAQPSFLAGIAAAGAAKSGIMGAIGETELPPVREGFDVYPAGSRSINPAIHVLTSSSSTRRQ